MLVVLVEVTDSEPFPSFKVAANDTRVQNSPDKAPATNDSVLGF